MHFRWAKHVGRTRRKSGVAQTQADQALQRSGGSRWAPRMHAQTTTLLHLLILRARSSNVRCAGVQPRRD